MLACTKNDLSVVRELVAANSNLLLRNKDGWTPFHIACRYAYNCVLVQGALLVCGMMFSHGLFNRMQWQMCVLGVALSEGVFDK